MRYLTISVGIISVLLALQLTHPVHAQTANWRGEYFNNIYLLGDAQIVESSAISFDWGTSPPAPGINADNFSVRWTGNAFFNAGTYRFFVRADDEIRLRVDNQIYIDTFGRNQVGAVVSADVNLTTGQHQIQIDYRERTGDAYAFVTWENAANNPQIPTFAPVQRVTTSAINLGGWTAQYYGNNSLSGLPTAILSEIAISQDWGEDSPIASLPADNFSARWTTSPLLDAGVYRFTVRADDGVRLFVDGKLEIDRWVDAEGDIGTIDLDLSAGLHNITVEYYEERGNAYITFTAERVDETTVVPTPIPAAQITGGSNLPVETGATATVDAFRLNVRQAPTTSAAVVIKIERGETYPIVGRSQQSDWWQINVNGTIGWVFADFIVATNTGNVPVTGSGGETQNVVLTDFRLTALNTINLRSQPSTRGAVLGLLPQNATAPIVGRNTSGTWIQIQYNDKIAWVSRGFVRLEGVSVDTLPIVPGQ